MNKNTKEFLIILYKTLIYFILLSIFVLFMSRVNSALLFVSRTSVITLSSYMMMLIMMMPVYGNFEIGERKTKPVFNATVISVFFTNIVAFMVLVIMGINQYPLSLLFTKGLIYLTMSFIIQIIVIWYGASWGNNFYFFLYKPAQTILIENESDDFAKVQDYILAHKKQYHLKKVYHNPDFKDLNFNNVDTVMSIGMETDFEKELTEYCYYHDIHLAYNSKIHDLFSGKNKTLIIDDILMIDFPKMKMSLSQEFMKRLLDILVSSILLILSSPIFLIIMFAIKWDDGGAIFYKQERLTKNGKKFMIIKFRSMIPNSGNEPVRENDERVTRVGQFVRKIRMDELPQFINILKGDMSIVGPRPESIEIMDRISEEVPEFKFRLKVKGGLTGYAQVFGRYNTSPHKKLLLDLKYIESYSVVNDLKLILQTVIVFFKSDSTQAFDNED